MSLSSLPFAQVLSSSCLKTKLTPMKPTLIDGRWEWEMSEMSKSSSRAST